MEAYAGIDLHSSNSYIGIIDEHDRRHFSKRLPNMNGNRKLTHRGNRKLTHPLVSKRKPYTL